MVVHAVQESFLGPRSATPTGSDIIYNMVTSSLSQHILARVRTRMRIMPP